MTANQIVRVIPVLKVNNRNVNQRFYEETLGMKVLVEEGALLSLGDASKVEKIVLEESPSMRSRKVEGPKKLGRIVVKVAQAQEIDYLLARQPETSALYQGANGRAFEVVSPQGDTIFVHAEENLESLEPLEKAPLVEAPEDFKGLTNFDVDFLEVNVADLAEAEKFYSSLPDLARFIHLQEAQGEDLQVENKVTWDLSMIKIELAPFDVEVLKVNNRNVNQRFYEEILGMKVLVEEGALLSLGDASKVEKIVLEESPSMRSRKVEGPKKLGRIVVKVAQAQEIDYLLARQPETSALYQGAIGRAFEVVSPQGDTVFVHAEENLESLEPLEKAPLVELPEDFKGLTSFDVDFLEVNVADLAQSQELYRRLPDLARFIHLQEAQGEDLQVENKVTWDLSMIKVELASFDVEDLKERLGEAVDFVHRKGTFLIAKDLSQIELWFEANQDQVHISYEE